MTVLVVVMLGVSGLETMPRKRESNIDISLEIFDEQWPLNGHGHFSTNNSHSVAKGEE